MLSEKRICSKKIYKGRAVDFLVDRVELPNKREGEREYLSHPGAVAIIPILNNKGDILLVRQYRYPVDRTLYELPAGKLEKGENPISTARRELREETGLAAGRMKKLYKFFTSPAFSTEIIHIYLALDLKSAKSKPDSDEFIQLKIFNIDQVINLIKARKIMDSKTIIGLMVWEILKGNYGVI